MSSRRIVRSTPIERLEEINQIDQDEILANQMQADMERELTPTEQSESTRIAALRAIALEENIRASQAANEVIRKSAMARAAKDNGTAVKKAEQQSKARNRAAKANEERLNPVPEGTVPEEAVTPSKFGLTDEESQSIAEDLELLEQQAKSELDQLNAAIQLSYNESQDMLRALEERAHDELYEEEEEQ